MALKYLLAGMAQSGAVLQQTLLNCEIIRQLLTAEATCISPAGRLLLRCALVTLRKRKRRVERQQDDDSGCISHSGLPLLRTKTQCPSVSSLEATLGPKLGPGCPSRGPFLLADGPALFIRTADLQFPIVQRA